MIGCVRTRVRKQPIDELYFESELVLKFYNLEARSLDKSPNFPLNYILWRRAQYWRTKRNVKL